MTATKLTPFQNSRRLMISTLSREKREAVESVAASMAAAGELFLDLEPFQLLNLKSECNGRADSMEEAGAMDCDAAIACARIAKGCRIMLELLKAE